MRCYTPVDQAIMLVSDRLNRFIGPIITLRSNPADSYPDIALTPTDRQKSIGLLRVNHAGEVCAQALYQGQALLARKAEIKAHLTKAADEEADHLHWCQTRIQALGGKISLLNPLWYVGSLLIGMAAGLCGDKISLGFLAETEEQVSAHLQDHLTRLPPADQKSRAIVTQMQIDEQMHANAALEHGGAPLPFGIPTLMRLSAKVMTSLTFYI